MKSNKGVTLTSLIIYVIGLIVLLGIMSNWVGYFKKNVNDIVIQDSAEEQYSRFLSYISKDTNAENLLVIKAGYELEEYKEYIIFKYKDGTEHQYIYQNKAIYYIDKENNKKILLCNNVLMNASEFFDYENGRIKLDFKIDNENYTTILNINI